MHSFNRYQLPSTQNAHGTQTGMTAVTVSSGSLLEQ